MTHDTPHHITTATATNLDVVRHPPHPLLAGDLLERPPGDVPAQVHHLASVLHVDGREARLGFPFPVVVIITLIVTIVIIGAVVVTIDLLAWVACCLGCWIGVTANVGLELERNR